MYTRGWPSVGLIIDTSDRPVNVCVTTDPPPPLPPTFRNNPPGDILNDVGTVKSALFLTTRCADSTAPAAVFGASVKSS